MFCTKLDVADVAVSVAVRVLLLGIEVHGAVITDVSDKIVVRIRLRRIIVVGAVVGAEAVNGQAGIEHEVRR